MSLRGPFPGIAGVQGKIQAAKQGERIVDARGIRMLREAVAVVEAPPCSQYILFPKPRVQGFQVLPIGSQIPVHFMFRKAAESTVGRHVGNVRHVCWRRRTGGCGRNE